ncbi:DeoR/GlpR family DNA-binding transcription regulator [Christensenellaceae bacterium OttesenSCG-928-K19]|nr:DeoR/GlpR family DNA-binding transcription regulator [Christensenellaceae bacterium OttesenSCG-928-K19]
MKTERREGIKDLLRARGEVKLKDLEKSFPDCSSMTLRRDLKYLEDNGFVRRTRGGAVAMSRLSIAAEDIYSERTLENVAQKFAIAKKAQQFIERGRSIYIDSGTTMMLFTREMEDEYLSIMTSGVNIAMELIKKQKPSVTLVGGQVNRNTISVSGVNSCAFIREVNIDVAFMASSGFSMENGFTSGTYTECEIKKEVISRARRKIILMDSKKVDKIMPFTFARMEDIDILVSDDELEEEIVREAARKNVQLI